MVTSFVDLVDPQATGVEAFVVRDGWFVPLRPLGWRHKDDKSERVGEVFGRKATGQDPLPVPASRIF